MTEIRNSKSVLVIEYWNLRFNCNLVLGIWDFVGAAFSRNLALCNKKRGRSPAGKLPRTEPAPPTELAFVANNLLAKGSDSQRLRPASICDRGRIAHRS